MTKDSTIIIHFGKFGYQYIVDDILIYHHDLTIYLASMIGIKVIETGNGKEDYKKKEEDQL